MHEIDLIPPEFRQARQRRRLLAQGAGLLLALLLATAGVRAWLAQAIADAQPRVVQRQAQSARSAALRTEWLALRAQVDRARARSDDLARLRLGVAWPRALSAIDAAWSPRVWLDQIEVAESAATAAAPAAAAASVAAADLVLKGHAADQAGLLAWLQALGARLGGAEPRLTHTGLRRYGQQDVLDFELTVPLAPPGAVDGTAADTDTRMGSGVQAVRGPGAER